MTTMTTNWIDAAARDDVPEDDVMGLAVAGRDIALYGVGGEVLPPTTSAPTAMRACAMGFWKGTRSNALCTRASLTCATANPPARPSPSRCAATP